MTPSADHEAWDIIDSPTTMASTEQQSTVSAPESTVEVTINTKPTDTVTPENKNETPALSRNDTMDSEYQDNMEPTPRVYRRPLDVDDEFIAPRNTRHYPRVVRVHRRNRSLSPGIYDSTAPKARLLNSSAELLDCLDHDGIADLPVPAKGSIYVTNFPFGKKDVKKWSWLFTQGTEDEYFDTWEDNDGLADRGRAGRPIPIRIHGRRDRRDRSPYYYDDRQPTEIPMVCLSRALDTSVVPESSGHDFTFLIVVRMRGGHDSGVKLLTAESRKAAGTLMYYEALVGNSVVFVGASLGTNKKKKTFRKVGSVSEAVQVSGEGVTAIIC